MGKGETSNKSGSLSTVKGTVVDSAVDRSKRGPGGNGFGSWHSENCFIQDKNLLEEGCTHMSVL